MNTYNCQELYNKFKNIKCHNCNKYMTFKNHIYTCGCNRLQIIESKIGALFRYIHYFCDGNNIIIQVMDDLNFICDYIYHNHKIYNWDNMFIFNDIFDITNKYDKILKRMNII